MSVVRACLASVVALAAVAIPAPAHAACNINVFTPADGATLTQTPSFTWLGNCSIYRLRLSTDPSFPPAMSVTTVWRPQVAFRFDEEVWDGYQAGDWAGGVYFQVQGRDAANVLTNSATRFVSMDPDLDDDGVSQGGGDCDDDDPTVYPGAADVCGDGIDSDCSGGTDVCSALAGTIDLSAANTIFVGEDAGDDGGTAVQIIQDIDGDGYDDVVVTGPDNAGGGSGRGAAYVFYGPVADGVLDLSTADAKIQGLATDDSVGDAVAVTGDLDGDGFGDLVVSMDAHETSGGTRISGNGTVYVFYGPVIGTTSVSSADAVLTGEADGSEFGFAINAQCDVDGDGADDLLVGAPDMSGNGRLSGAAYLFHGPLTGSYSASTDAYAIYYGEGADETAGHSIGCAGDLDADGYDDIVIGGDENDAGGVAAGAAYVYYGPVTGGTHILSDADAKLIGENAGDGAGIAFSGGSDLTGDGRDDLAISAVLWDGFVANSGLIYVVDSPVTGSWDLSNATIRLTGSSGEQAGTFLSQAGDVNGDGQADLLVGARRADGGGADSGVAYLFYGPLSGTRALSDADVLLVGEEPGDLAGTSGSICGDTDGDGGSDILLGATRNDRGGSDAGAAYLVLSGG